MTAINPRDYLKLLQSDFLTFAFKCFVELNPGTPLIKADFLRVVGAELDACRLGTETRLIVCVPPRSLKSVFASVAFPLWVIGHNPSAQVICASYGQDLAEKFARDRRKIMESAFYQTLFPTRLRRRSAADLETTAGGAIRATSVNGPLTGLGADFIILDDVLKPDEALSDTRRQAVNHWYANTLQSRLNNKETGRIIIVMQRLHQDDLVGFVTELEDWNNLSFPAIAERDEVYVVNSVLGRYRYSRKTGEALNPLRESLPRLEKIRHLINDYNFNSQYQQNPTSIAGLMVKRESLQYYLPGQYPKPDRVVQSWDTANKPGELNAFSVCTTWAVAQGKFYLLNVFRAHLEYPDLKRAVLEQRDHFNPQNIVIEDKASGTQLIQDLQREGIYQITPYKPTSGMDKTMRWRAQTDLFANGYVFLPDNAPWLNTYVDEVTGFPGTKFNDQVDSTAQALAYMRVPDDAAILAEIGRLAKLGIPMLGRH